MPWSHHSHSGQFCGHANDNLEEIVRAAIAKGMTTFCLTEHMPRAAVDFYPEEDQVHTETSLAALFEGFYREACRLQHVYAPDIELIIGFECEWIRPSSRQLIEELLNKYSVNMFVGSVHHTLCYPIDYDQSSYNQARIELGGTDQDIFAQYFDDQFDMLQALRPPVVGHFDLIRLKSDDPNASFKSMAPIWNKIERNLQYVAEYGGVLELNSSSLRKGMNEAYPQVEICEYFRSLGGRFTLSDDSHGIAQVGLNYTRVMDCVERAGIKQLHYLSRASSIREPVLERFAGMMTWCAVDVEKLRQHRFWTLAKQ